jgi:hypothetical protein
MAKYIEIQRANLGLDGEWHPQLAKVMAKDYAVLARLGERDGMDTSEGQLQDYFIAGIRGLGTWGATWFLDRKFKILGNYKEGKDVELLLEVEYRNGGIFDVKDVSTNSQDYFDSEASISTIRKNVMKFAPRIVRSKRGLPHEAGALATAHPT